MLKVSTAAVREKLCWITHETNLYIIENSLTHTTRDLPYDMVNTLEQIWQKILLDIENKEMREARRKSGVSSP